MRGFGGFLTNLVTGDSETGQKLAHFLCLKTLQKSQKNSK